MCKDYINRLVLFFVVDRKETSLKCRCKNGADKMYIDENISLREDLSNRLQQDSEELQGYYDVDDWFMFDTVFEAVEATVKAYYLARKISIADLNRIFEKHGIA